MVYNHLSAGDSDISPIFAGAPRPAVRRGHAWAPAWGVPSIGAPTKMDGKSMEHIYIYNIQETSNIQYPPMKKVFKLQYMSLIMSQAIYTINQASCSA